MTRHWGAITPGVRAGRVSVAAVVGVELVVVGLAFTVRGLSARWHFVGLALLLLAAVSTPWRGHSLVRHALERLSYVHPRRLLVPLEIRSQADGEVAVPASVRALFDGVRVVQMVDARGRECGAAFHGEVISVAIRGRAPREGSQLPLNEIWGALKVGSVRVDAVSCLVASLASPPEDSLGHRMRQDAVEAGRARPQECLFVVRVRRDDLERATRAHGGRREGQSAALAAVASRAASALAYRGWAVRVLSGREIVDEAVMTLGGSAGDGWTESWGAVTGPGVTHVSSTLSLWSGVSALDDLTSAPSCVVTWLVERVAQREVRPGGTRVLARMTRRGERGGASHVRWREGDRAWSVLEGEQLAGLRATTVLGEGR